MNSLAQTIVKLRWLIILAVIAVTVFFAIQIKHLIVDSDVLSSLPDDEPVAKLHKEVGNKYEGMSVALIVLETDDAFKKEVLEHIKQITDTLKYTEGVATISNLTDVFDIKKVDGGIEVGKLIDEYDLPQSQVELDELKKHVFSKDLYKGSIVSDDGTATVITLIILEKYKY